MTNWKKAGFAFALAGAGMARADEVETNTWTMTTCNSPAAAYEWSVPGNWSLGHAPADETVVKFNAGSVTNYYIRLDGTARVCGFQPQPFTRTVGGTIEVTPRPNVLNTSAKFYGNYSTLYSEVILNRVSSGSYDTWLSFLDIAAPVTVKSGTLVVSSGTVALRTDKFARTADAVRTDDARFLDTANGGIFPGNGHFSVYAGGADAAASAWNQTAGSPFVTRAGDEPVTVAAGAAVSGAGVPAGTFVTRCFDDGCTYIELSQPVTETRDANTLSFAAHHPQVTVTIPNVTRQGDGGSALKAYRRTAADTLRLDIARLGNGNSRQWWNLGLTKADAPWLPGTYVLRNIAGNTDSFVHLRDCHLEFAGKADGSPTTFTDRQHVTFDDGAHYTARLTVPAGKTGVVAVLTNFTGTVVKDGAGELRVGLAEAENAGRFEVEAGTLTVTAGASAGTDTSAVKALVLRAGAVLKLPAGGLRAEEAEFEAGAAVAGPSTLVVAGRAEKAGAVELRDGARVRYELGTAENYVHGQGGAVTGHPAFWVDASQPETMELVAGADGAQEVARWNDCRAGEPMFATNVALRPYLVRGAAPTENYVRIPHVATHDYRETHGLVWSVPVDGIKSIFLVQDPTEGGGEVLGRTARLPDSWYGSQGGPFYRTASDKWSSPLLSAAKYGTACVTNGVIRLDGLPVDPGTQGYLGAFTQVLEVHINPAYASGAAHNDFCLDAFGTGGYRNLHEFANCNGWQRIHECIIYTNELTYVEQVRVAQHLLRKWTGKELRFDDTAANRRVTALVMGPGESVSVPADRTAAVEQIESGSALTKEGAGRLVVNSLKAGDVTVRAGELVVKSFRASADVLPGDAWVHMDASAPGTVETDADGNVTAWRSAGADGQAYRPLGDGKSRLVADAANGRAVIDTGTYGESTSGAFRLYKADGTPYEHPNENNFIDGPAVRAMVMFAGSHGGGGSLLGGYSNGYPWQGLPHYKAMTNSIAVDQDRNASRNPYVLFDPATINSFSVGSSVFRVNGERVNPFDTPFSGGYDVFTLSWQLTNRKSDTLATYGQGVGRCGGLEFGEVVIYTNAVELAQLSYAEAYLRRKWQGVDTPGLCAAACGTLRVDAGATVTVGGWNPTRGGAAYGAGDGALTAAGLGGGGTVRGDVTLAADADLLADVADDGSVACLTLAGALDASRGGTLRVTGNLARLTPGTYPIVTATSLAWNAAQWTVDSPFTNLALSLSADSTTINLRVSARATLIILK